jgi:type VI secretion system secreted protein VgrG
MFALRADFDTSEETVWAAPILKDCSCSTEERFEQLYTKTLQELERHESESSPLGSWGVSVKAFSTDRVNPIADGLKAAWKAISLFSTNPVSSVTQQCAGAKVVKTGLGAEADQEVVGSPKLVAHIQQLQANGWKIQYGDKCKGSYADRAKKIIVVDSNEKGKTAQILQILAHEIGHARYKPDSYVPPTGLSKKQYVDANVKSNLKDEGEATITNIEIRNELKANGGPDIGIAGAQAEKYEELYSKFPDAKDRDKLREEIGNVFATGEQPSTDPLKIYRDYYDYYADPYEKFYDKNASGKTK